MREKWTSRPDYRQATISKALNATPKSDTFVYNLKPLFFTDVCQARLLSSEYSDKLRYSHATGFLFYNGKFWEENDLKAQAVVQHITLRQLNEVTNALKFYGDKLLKIGVDPKNAKTEKRPDDTIQRYIEAISYRDHCLKMQDSRKIMAVLKEVRPHVAITVDELDRNPFLLNATSGTFNLKTGEMKPHNPTDYLTHCTSVSPSEQGNDIWQNFLYTVFCADEAVIDYVQSVCGLCAIGQVFVEQIVISHGEGRNGKSTFWNPIFKVFGTYAGSLSAEALTARCRHNTRPELANLRRKRMVLARELSEGRRLDESFLKQISSTDPIHVFVKINL